LSDKPSFSKKTTPPTVIGIYCVKLNITEQATASISLMAKKPRAILNPHWVTPTYPGVEA